jgi:hypothetical protein
MRNNWFDRDRQDLREMSSEGDGVEFGGWVLIVVIALVTSIFIGERLFCHVHGLLNF